MICPISLVNVKFNKAILEFGSKTISLPKLDVNTPSLEEANLTSFILYNKTI